MLAEPEWLGTPHTLHPAGGEGLGRWCRPCKGQVSPASRGPNLKGPLSPCEAAQDGEPWAGERPQGHLGLPCGGCPMGWLWTKAGKNSWGSGLPVGSAPGGQGRPGPWAVTAPVGQLWGSAVLGCRPHGSHKTFGVHCERAQGPSVPFYPKCLSAPIAHFWTQPLFWGVEVCLFVFLVLYTF